MMDMAQVVEWTIADPMSHAKVMMTFQENAQKSAVNEIDVPRPF